MSENGATALQAQLKFIPPGATGHPVMHTDLRQRSAGYGVSSTQTIDVADARGLDNLGLHVSGFELVQAPTAVSDFYNCDEVMRVYYDECKTLARRLTGAHTTFTFDHIVREPNRQFNGGGLDGRMQESGVANGGGHINGVHMDYTDRTTWERYLGLHDQQPPTDVNHTYVLNFWRAVSESVDDNPLAVCDARTVRTEDLQEVDVYGYGASNYSWYDIGIETFSVCAAERHQWYYYSNMSADEVLVIKSFDSDGVVGRTSPHASFAHPQPRGIPRRSIELRVLCFC